MPPPAPTPTSPPPAGPPHPDGSPHTPGQQGDAWQRVMALQPQAPSPRNATRRPLIRRIIVTSAVVTVFGLAALVMGGLVFDLLGLTAAGLALVSASIAIGVVVPTFLWVDRLEQEPGRLLWFAFLWGALISTLLALVLNELGVAFFAGLHAEDPLVLGAVVVAPVVEEMAKGLGVLLIFWRARREFNGVADGIVYAGIVAAGFAFVENILYLGSAYVEMGTPGLVGLFVVRCLVSPFAHPMFTVCTGLALGLVAHRRRWSSAWIVLIGLAAAIFLHALWNYSAVVAADAYLEIFVVVQVPLFVAFLLLLRWARRRESRILRDSLTGYGLAGWYTPAEVAMLADPGERRRARRWARAAGGRPAQAAMTAFQDESGELAMVRHHLEQEGGGDVEWLRRERVLLETVTAHRRVFVPGV
ncbi:PrsW family intramembrane metalloprotease [Ornithinimicrobium avium]|uniref:PrsW family intramembrane metalloprotease n=1 Tax=Ornithinimicrobium avium TaxID=2283195 RepID=A0A345NLN7_9MICO|nr:PrsW family intramembrane metalloprotease [Ornithinimicrobium avium]AXH95945.1 PrsW family intramembrane metalloprotease [Ornithinimicrobium avium]